MPCATLSWFPNHDPLQVGETYQFTACCVSPKCTPRLTWFVLGAQPQLGGELEVTSGCIVWSFQLPSGATELRVHVQCRDPGHMMSGGPGTPGYCCDEFFIVPVAVS